ncbi:MATE family efflux transporter DinF [Vibrio sp. TH_r3]|uniref:MATE family efflux transporter DinF n=1 Tax=Vibrio sp. TH_r3 TaxID=3082084 RepID=UPI002953E147|nr:MATE family efflux transporter DinF [Vibrio sp. TH_r3]MDV7106038.1 MATE family efflux transporter DinF [Vibrio sp. TH_r3]
MKLSEVTVGNSFLSILRDTTVHKQVLLLAIPMVLSNITVPILGLVDAAVVGHLSHSWYLGGVALGGTIISVSFWLFGFLRMSTTGLSAQAFGGERKEQQGIILIQGLTMAFLFAFVFLLLHTVIGEFIFNSSNASDEVKHYGEIYFSIRAWSAPATLANYVLLGWLLGTQNAKAPMWIVIIANLTNIVLDVVFVVWLDWKVAGAAYASVIAEYISLLVGFSFVVQTWRQNLLPNLFVFIRHRLSTMTTGLSRFIKLNRDIFLRSLCLQAAFSFMTFQGASYGDDIVAANAVLMSLLMVISYGMDGFAYAIEAMVGKAVGARNRSDLKQSIVVTFFWGVVICSTLTLIFFIFGNQLIATITDIDRVRDIAAVFLPWLVAMPLCSMWCFILDGIFIGATKGREMRNSMFVAACSFFSLFYLLSEQGNHALWAAMLGFMLMRGASLAVVFIMQWRKKQFI